MRTFQRVEAECEHCGQLKDGLRLQLELAGRKKQKGCHLILERIIALPPGWALFYNEDPYDFESYHLYCESCHRDAPMRYRQIRLTYINHDGIDISRHPPDRSYDGQ